MTAGGAPVPIRPRSSARPLALIISLLVAIALAAGAFVLISGGSDGGAGSDAASEDSPDAAAADTVAESDSSTETAPSRRPRATAATVARTCGADGAGDCFLSVRGRPTADSVELERLDEGARVRIECQRTGGETSSSVLGDEVSYVWSRTVDGGYVANVFLDGSELDPFERTLPRCD